MQISTHSYRRKFSMALLLCVTALAACKGDYSGGPANATSGSGDNGGSTDNSGTPGGPEFASTEAFFTARITPRLHFCRTCHIPGGVADTDEGRRFLLSSNSGDDFANTFSSWQTLGRGIHDSPLIIENADSNEPHSGGKSWPVGSDAYKDMITLLTCWETPANCTLNASGDLDIAYPLLGDARGGNRWANFCEGKADDAVLPRDPRTLVVPGVNEGKAVGFNAYWSDCNNAVPHPTTCGEFREQYELGEFVGLGNGEIGTPTSFSGGNPNPSGLSVDNYNSLWEVWGLSERPDNFDQLVAERYGSPQSLVRNPYPLPGEDPNETEGGSGQLPMVFTQLRSPDGKWKGEIGTKVCVYCHSGQLGSAQDGPGLGPQPGGAGSIGDFTVASYDFAKAGDYQEGATAGITIATNRGTGAIDFFQLGFVLFSGGDPELLANDKILLSQAIGTIKSPPWWNMGYRPQKFHGAVLPTDSSRIDMAAYYDLGKGLSGGDAISWIDQHAGPFQVWAEALASPQYPEAIDTALAEQGAILFHSKDLWAEEGNPAPRPAQGNGSCASCHGVYSPHFAHDPAYLETPELMGVAGYYVPHTIAGTDPVYAEAMQSLRNSDGSVSPAIMNNDLLYCGVGAAGHTPNNTPIYLAPPLWGIWAAAPYFHNGSVPNIWGVLDPASERPRIWRRVSAPAREDQVGKVVMGYDTNLQRAFDFDKLGWKYDELECGQTGTAPFVDCDPVMTDSRPLLEQILGVFYTRIALLWNLPRVDMIGMSNQQIEARKIYNTNEYSQGNQGHEFTSVLTDAERRAIVEYLKTL